MSNATECSTETDEFGSVLVLRTERSSEDAAARDEAIGLHHPTRLHDLVSQSSAVKPLSNSTNQSWLTLRPFDIVEIRGRSDFADAITLKADGSSPFDTDATWFKPDLSSVGQTPADFPALDFDEVKSTEAPWLADPHR